MTATGMLYCMDADYFFSRKDILWFCFDSFSAVGLLPRLQTFTTFVSSK